MNRMITPEEVKVIAIARKSMDKYLIKDSIIDAAELDFIKPMLGKDFYNELRWQYLTNTLTTDNSYLIDNYLKRALAYRVLSMCLPTIMLDISSVGIQVNSTEFSSPVSSSQRAELTENINGIAKTFLQEAGNYIEENSSKYPLYSTFNNIDRQINITGGLILDDSDLSDDESSSVSGSSQNITNVTIVNSQDSNPLSGIDENVSSYSGGGQANAVSLSKRYNIVTTAAYDYDSCKLPQATVGMRLVVYNQTAKIISIYPYSGEYIGDVQNYQFNVAPSSAMSFECYSTGRWMSGGLSV